VKASGYTVNNSFDQLLSQYHSARLPIYNQSTNEMHTLFFGGMARYYYDQNGTMVDDENVPFVKTISLVTRDASGAMIEQSLNLQMPAFLGSGAEFIQAENVNYTNGAVLDLNALPAGELTLVGYIYGGIESSQENIFFINDGSQSWASNRLFKVYIESNTSTGIETRAISGDDVFTLQVFPNPSENETTACLTSKYMTSGTLEVFNSVGQLVRSITVDTIHNTHKHFDLKFDGAESGTYLVRFSNKVFSTSTALIVK